MALLATTALLAVVVPASPASAGGWAVTYLDPLPDRFEPGRSYTVGFWVLQHGSHPFVGDLGATGLTLTDESGAATSFAGVRLPEAAHYAAAIAIPRAGRFTVTAKQGRFEPYRVGTISVPGRLAVDPPPTPMDLHGDHSDGWGAIRPPVAAALAVAKPEGTPPGEPGNAPPAVAALAGANQGTSGSWWVAVMVVSGAILAVVLLWRRPLAAAGRSVHRRARRRTVTG